MQYVLIFKGIPASGKSTEAELMIRREPNRWKRINKDSMRNLFDAGIYSQENESLIRDIEMILVKEFLSRGYNVIYDNTNIKDKGRNFKKICSVVQSIGIECIVQEKFFDVSLDEAIERDSKRTGSAHVGEDIIKEFYRTMKNSSKELRKEYFQKRTSFALEQDKSLQHILICDLDGTLFNLNGRNPYDASTCENDLVNESVLNTLLNYISSNRADVRKIIFLSGREEKYRSQSEKAIDKAIDKSKNHWQLHMRKTGDNRKDSIIKKELFDEHIKDKYYVDFVLDDRDQVVFLWRSLGLSCFQVNYGDF